MGNLPQETVELYVSCECSVLTHLMRFTYYREYRELYVHFFLESERSFFKRLINAVLYLFGKKSKFGDFGEIIICKKSQKDLLELLHQINLDNKRKDKLL